MFNQPRPQNRYARKNSQGGQSSIYTPAPEYDDPANCDAPEDDQYVSVKDGDGDWIALAGGDDYNDSLFDPLQRRYTRVNNQGQYGGGGAEYDDPANCTDYYGAPYDHYGSRKSVGSARIVANGSPEPPLPPPRNHAESLNDSKESNEISEAECDRDHPRGTYGGKL